VGRTHNLITVILMLPAYRINDDGNVFQEVAEICFLRLNLILIAVEARKYEGGQIWINPR
jgi:hypothetical protein